MTNRVVVVAPHADDEVLGCGAVIAKHCSHDEPVSVVIVTNASVGAPEMFSQVSISRVRQEALEAHKTLGVSETLFFDFPAPALNTFPMYKVSLALNAAFARLKPDVLYLPYPGDLHEDHRCVYRASLVAARPAAWGQPRKILCYETLSETDWTPVVGEVSFVPNVFVDVTEHFQVKLDAMQCFESQLKAFPHSRSLDALDALSKLRGSTVGVERAEAFALERMLL